MNCELGSPDFLILNPDFRFPTGRGAKGEGAKLGEILSEFGASDSHLTWNRQDVELPRQGKRPTGLAIPGGVFPFSKALVRLIGRKCVCRGRAASRHGFEFVRSLSARV
jgi:hypothetical protein